MLGLSSFFLIGFYKNKISSLKAALKAFFFNKISDVFLLIAFIIYYIIYNTTTILNFNNNTNINELIGLLIVLTSMLKSAQFIFYF